MGGYGVLSSKPPRTGPRPIWSLSTRRGSATCGTRAAPGSGSTGRRKGSRGAGRVVNPALARRHERTTNASGAARTLPSPAALVNWHPPAPRPRETGVRPVIGSDPRDPRGRPNPVAQIPPALRHFPLLPGSARLPGRFPEKDSQESTHGAGSSAPPAPGQSRTLPAARIGPGRPASAPTMRKSPRTARG